MAIESNDPDVTRPPVPNSVPDSREGHGSGLEKAKSEPKQGVGEAWSDNRPEDWNPPPGDPGAGQGVGASQDDDTAKVDEKQGGPAPRSSDSVPLAADDDAPVEQEMKDVDANNAVSSEHPKPA
ncbi:hypothetical protein SAMN05216185_101544 [Pseudomonas guariconensis]|uniref:hypothetical protein n=1 Tax=Pseudomonas guariconensis TaxID=1288410 RepID=UPI00088C9E7E|nr:hypothetical protein [Pseudomonas guariconensis]SDC15081.1 hypothetical protein SAMN05216185_101544 [Pseudomonas guariconensis]